MGLSSSKSKTTPVYDKQITGASNTLTDTYNTNAPKVQATADSLTGLLPGMIDKYKAGNPALNAASGYVTKTLADGGSNPYLDQWIAQNQNDVQNQLGASLGKMGLGPAGTTYQALQARELGKVALGARVDDWTAAQGRQAQAAGMAPSISAAESASIAPMLATAELGSNLPMNAASQYAAGQGGLLGGYTNQTQKGSVLDSLGKVVQIGTQVAGAFSDERLKEDVREVGKTKEGLPIYTYRFKGDDQVQMGVMAQEVAKKQPAALGAKLGGYRTVHYGEVR